MRHRNGKPPLDDAVRRFTPPAQTALQPLSRT
jgi:hypothetical protein